MKHILITDSMRKEARVLAEEMGALRNSVSEGRKNTIGFLGELIVASLLPEHVFAHSYDFDMLYGNATIDVKSTTAGQPPLPEYEVTVFNPNQNVDYYVFTRVHKNEREGWVLGYLPKSTFFELSQFKEKGSFSVDRKGKQWVYYADCYVLPISSLRPIDELTV